MTSKLPTVNVLGPAQVLLSELSILGKLLLVSVLFTLVGGSQGWHSYLKRGMPRRLEFS